jgi:hypothetical protein
LDLACSLPASACTAIAGAALGPLPLALGENTIHITVYPNDKQSGVQEKALKIYYLEEQ